MTRLVSLVLVVRELDRAGAVWERGLGFTRTAAASDVPSLGARHVLLRADNCVLELLEPYDDSKPPGLFLRARGEGMFGVSVGVDEADATATRLDGLGLSVVTSGAAGIFLRPAEAHGLLLEVAAIPAKEERKT